MVNFTLKKYFFLLVLFPPYGCHQYHQMEMGALASKNKAEGSSVRYTQLQSFDQPKHPLPDFYVVLVPGFGINGSRINNFKQELTKKFGEKHAFMQIECLQKCRLTTWVSAPQVEQVYQEILHKLHNKFELGSLTEADAQAYIKVPMHILVYGQHTLGAYMGKSQPIFESAAFNIATLSVASVIENKGQKKVKHVCYFNGNEEKITSDYIDLLATPI